MDNEGRRRPSLIAAATGAALSLRTAGQRGAPAPLPHCGFDGAEAMAAELDATRGAGAPPSLRHLSRRQRSRRSHTTRGAGAPPSLRPPPSPHSSTGAPQRGAPAPLPHCGRLCRFWLARRPRPTRGAGAPPSLRRFAGRVAPRPTGFNEGRRRPSLIAAEAGASVDAALYAQRGAPAPLPHCGKRWTRHPAGSGGQRGAPAPLPHCGQAGGGTLVEALQTTRGAGAPPSLRPLFATISRS